MHTLQCQCMNTHNKWRCPSPIKIEQAWNGFTPYCNDDNDDNNYTVYIITPSTSPKRPLLSHFPIKILYTFLISPWMLVPLNLQESGHSECVTKCGYYSNTFVTCTTTVMLLFWETLIKRTWKIVAKKLCNETNRVSCHCRVKCTWKIGFSSGFFIHGSTITNR